MKKLLFTSFTLFMMMGCQPSSPRFLEDFPTMESMILNPEKDQLSKEPSDSFKPGFHPVGKQKIDQNWILAGYFQPLNQGKYGMGYLITEEGKILDSLKIAQQEDPSTEFSSYCKITDVIEVHTSGMESVSTFWKATSSGFVRESKVEEGNPDWLE